MNKTEIIEIVGLGSNGDGYGLLNDKKVFVPFTAPGDQVALAANPHSKAPIFQVIAESPYRQTPPCPYFGTCGGCQLQHLQPDLYSAFKKEQVAAPLLAHKVVYNMLSDPIILGPHLRRRVVLKAEKMQKKVLLGYFARQSHDLLDIQECPVVVPEIEVILSPLRLFLQTFLTSSAKAEIAVTYTSSGLDIGFKFDKKRSLNLGDREALVSFAQIQKIACLRVDDEIIVKFQTPLIAFEQIKVEVDANAFLQASTAADNLLASLIHEHLQSSSLKIADLFCGRGTLTLPLLKHGRVDAYETDRQALAPLQKAVNATHQGPLLKTVERHLFHEPLTVAELKVYDRVILDPPRTGAMTQVKQLAQSNVEQIIYVSCNPQTFARDAVILTEKHYILDKIIPIDQFHWSVHTELFAVFQRQKD